MVRSAVLTVKILTDAASAAKGLKTASSTYEKFTKQLGIRASPAGLAAGTALVNGIDKALGVGLKVIGAAGGAVLGTALFKGWERLNQFDQATAKLRGLGHDTKAVEAIMENTNQAALGTMFSWGEAAGVAATAVASGIAPGRELEQLTSRQIPVLQYLADHYGVTADEASKMVSRGEVDFANFAAAMQKNLGGATLEAGNTMEGAWSLTMASLGRIDEKFLQPIFESTTESLKGLPARSWGPWRALRKTPARPCGT